MSMDSLDMSLSFGDEQQQQQFGSTLLQALKSRGVAKIKNHGIPDDQISELFNVVGCPIRLPLRLPQTDLCLHIDQEILCLDT